MAAMIQAVGGCQCSGCSTTLSGQVSGCSLPVPAGFTVEAHDSTSGGTLLDSTTTDSSGNYTLSISAATAGNDIVIVVPATTRFTVTTKTLNWTSGTVTTSTWKCGSTGSLYDVAMVPESGYHCSAFCALPLKDSLPCTVSSNVPSFTGPTTRNLIYSVFSTCGGAGWQVDFLSGFDTPPVNVLGFLLEVPGIVSAQVELFPPCSYFSVTVNACPPALNITGSVVDSSGYTTNYLITE